MRRLRAAIIASMISHASALAWIAHDGRVLAVPLRERAPLVPGRPPPAPSEDLTVVLFDDRASLPSRSDDAPSPSPSPASTRSPTSTPAARSTVVATTASTRELPGPERPSVGDPRNTPPGPPARSSWMTMRPRDRPTERGLSDEFVTRFVERSRPLAPPPDIPWESLTEQIAELRRRHASPAEIVALTQKLADEELKPTGRGTYRASKETFIARLDADGTTHLEDRPERLDAQDAIMLRHGVDPYARNKLALLDRTRDQRAAVGESHRRDQLAHAAQLMQRNIDRLWASTPDLAARKAGLFALWDDCAESGSDELVAGATAARALVIGVIRARVRDASAYTAAELAELNARRRSAARFAPYE